VLSAFSAFSSKRPKRDGNLDFFSHPRRHDYGNRFANSRIGHDAGAFAAMLGTSLP